MTFAEELHAALAAAHVTQRAAAKRLGVPSRTFESWCMGQRVPPAYTRESVLSAIRGWIPDNE